MIDKLHTDMLSAQHAVKSVKFKPDSRLQKTHVELSKGLSELVADVKQMTIKSVASMKAIKDMHKRV
eukprot:9614964-Alexandrium_andersonii.AAC.1